MYKKQTTKQEYKTKQMNSELKVKVIMRINVFLKSFLIFVSYYITLGGTFI